MIKAIVYHVLSNPNVHSRLRAELDAAKLSFPATFEQTDDLPFLDAVLKEAMRIHPILGGLLERIVPESGLSLPDGRVIAPGTIVGMNPWVVHRNQDVYGQDVEAFRPERWLRHDLESPEAYEIRVKRMRETDFTFGGGSRVCIGKYSARMQMSKTVATLFSRYDVSHAVLSEQDCSKTLSLHPLQIEFVPVVKQWTTRSWWFTFSDHVRVHIRKRKDIFKA